MSEPKTGDILQKTRTVTPERVNELNAEKPAQNQGQNQNANQNQTQNQNRDQGSNI